MTDEHRAPVEHRTAEIAGVSFAQRIIEMIAVPYNETTLVMYRGEPWEERVEPGAFDGVEKRPNRIKANRDHDVRRTIGKALNLWPSREEGLVAEIRIAQTALGDETLALAEEDILGASVGFAVPGSGQVLNRPKRTIRKAFLDHIALLPNPAYEGALVTGVRGDNKPEDAADMAPLDTPHVDEVVAWLETRKQNSP
ncbi:MAG: hypothetical protein GEU73_07610 [Chloroflexi bacterium]|nr:hypothetical protein [Chloroflexota bacterium]